MTVVMHLIRSPPHNTGLSAEKRHSSCAIFRAFEQNHLQKHICRTWHFKVIKILIHNISSFMCSWLVENKAVNCTLQCSFPSITFTGPPWLFLEKWDLFLLRVINVFIGDLRYRYSPLWRHTHGAITSRLQPSLGAPFLTDREMYSLTHLKICICNISPLGMQLILSSFFSRPA